MKNKLFGIILLAVAAALVPSFADGGVKATQAAGEVKIGAPPYTISPARTRMKGSVMAAHNSADTTQYIGCQTSANAGTWSIGYCYARTASGTTAMCSTSDAGVIRAMGSINATSYIAVDYENNSGNCMKIEILNDSRNVAPIASATAVSTGASTLGMASP
jgi:hypothetical protein